MPLDRAILDESLRTPQGEAAYRLCEKLYDSGFDTWWVGGCVRDMLQGRIPEDIDIATNATPEQIKTVYPDAGSASAVFGSMRVIVQGREFEVTTFRSDDEASDGRHPESVVFSDRAHDAARRDFTVNAMYLQPVSRELFDPYDGQKDLKELLIRFIGDPGMRIRHDALRILRAVRFRALLNGQYHPETYTALKENASHIEILSGERIRSELEKILLGPHPARGFEDLWELSVLQYILPELAACKGVAQPSEYHQEGDVWDHLMTCISAFSEDDDADIRWATLLHDIGKTQTFSLEERIRFDHHAQVSADLALTLLERLQMQKLRREKISWIIRHHMMMASFEPMPGERKAHWYYHPWFPSLLRLFALDIAGTIPGGTELYDQIVADYTQYLDSHPRPLKPLLSGTDIMDLLGLQPGEEVGRIIKELHDAQQRGEITQKKEAIAFLTSLQRTDAV